MRFTVVTSARAKSARLWSATRSFSAEDRLEHGDALGYRSDVAGVVTDVVTVVVVHGAVGMAVEASHQQASRVRSIDAIRNSSPLTSYTSLLSQSPHSRIGMSNSSPSAGVAVMTAGTWSMTSSHPSSSVSSVRVPTRT